MNIYQIDASIRALIDEDTGEINDFNELDKLLSIREDKIEAAAIIYKQMVADAAAIKDEIDELGERKKAADRNAERLKQYISDACAGTPHETARVKITYCASKGVAIENESNFIKWAKQNAAGLLTFSEPKISKTAVGDALKHGVNVPGATRRTKNNK